ncbi:Zinc finger protein [Pseudolycoriella hygida]|uniref:Zinc finger protein n=1 Tax=Pseudolycoriella hygida TaxID=35572 RepID=A0A9Q0S668_9DIPT|nr:Zinc finger protein [Pseudolycoriella hygida]
MDRCEPTLRITVKDFSEICRFCMRRCEILKTIFDDEMYSDEKSITDMFKESLNLDIERNTQLPLSICSDCIEKLKNSYNFRRQCIDSLTLLNEICEGKQNTSESFLQDDNELRDTTFFSEIEIKEEDQGALLDECGIDDVIEPTSDNYSELKVERRKVKKKVGRPRKKAKDKVVKAPGMCQICGGLYVGLKYHMFVHDIPQFECDYCGRKFKHKSNLFAHVRIHANDRKHQCPHCPYKFQDRAKYKRHLRIHTGERNINCDLCGKAFCRKTDMLKHRLIHDVPRVPCPYCDKMFTTKTNMLSHIGIHTGERNFKCEICGAAFIASSSLSNHRKIHKKENPIINCKECGIILADTAMLKNHMRDHQKIVMLE